MIFAKVDVVLPRHHRMQAIDRASAFGVYVAALCHTREHELDGFVPLTAFRGFPSHSKRDVDDLVRVGLLETAEREGISGYAIVKYSEKNETKAEIDERRDSDRTRKRVSRRTPSGIRPESGEIPTVEGAGFPGSGSGSGSDPDPEGSAEGGWGLPDVPDPPPEFLEIFAGLEMATGVRLHPLEEWDSFRDYVKIKTIRSADWKASWSKWLRDAAKYAKRDALRSAAAPKGSKFAKPDTGGVPYLRAPPPMPTAGPPLDASRAAADVDALFNPRRIA